MLSDSLIGRCFELTVDVEDVYHRFAYLILAERSKDSVYCLRVSHLDSAGGFEISSHWLLKKDLAEKTSRMKAVVRSDFDNFYYAALQDITQKHQELIHADL